MMFDTEAKNPQPEIVGSPRDYDEDDIRQRYLPPILHGSANQETVHEYSSNVPERVATIGDEVVLIIDREEKGAEIEVRPGQEKNDATVSETVLPPLPVQLERTEGDEPTTSEDGDDEADVTDRILLTFLENGSPFLRNRNFESKDENHDDDDDDGGNSDDDDGGNSDDDSPNSFVPPWHSYNARHDGTGTAGVRELDSKVMPSETEPQNLPYNLNLHPGGALPFTTQQVPASYLDPRENSETIEQEKLLELYHLRQRQREALRGRDFSYDDRVRLPQWYLIPQRENVYQRGLTNVVPADAQPAIYEQYLEPQPEVYLIPERLPPPHQLQPPEQVSYPISAEKQAHILHLQRRELERLRYLRFLEQQAPQRQLPPPYYPARQHVYRQNPRLNPHLLRRQSNAIYPISEGEVVLLIAESDQNSQEGVANNAALSRLPRQHFDYNYSPRDTLRFQQQYTDREFRQPTPLADETVVPVVRHSQNYPAYEPSTGTLSAGNTDTFNQGENNLDRYPYTPGATLPLNIQQQDSDIPGTTETGAETGEEELTENDGESNDGFQQEEIPEGAENSEPSVRHGTEDPTNLYANYRLRQDLLERQRRERLIRPAALRELHGRQSSDVPISALYYSTPVDRQTQIRDNRHTYNVHPRYLTTAEGYPLVQDGVEPIQNLPIQHHQRLAIQRALQLKGYLREQNNARRGPQQIRYVVPTDRQVQEQIYPIPPTQNIRLYKNIRQIPMQRTVPYENVHSAPPDVNSRNTRNENVDPNNSLHQTVTDPSFNYLDVQALRPLAGDLFSDPQFPVNPKHGYGFGYKSFYIRELSDDIPDSQLPTSPDTSDTSPSDVVPSS